MPGRLFFLCTYLCFSLFSVTGSAFTGNIRGKVTTQQGKGIGDVSVRIEALSLHAFTDSNGDFIFYEVKEGRHRISFEHDLYAFLLEDIEVKKGLTEEITFHLIQSSALENVTVAGKSMEQELREKPIKAVIVNTRDMADRPNTLAELMNRSPGIRIRQSGGTGNPADVSINGFQGNSVQYFRDGIPLEYLGGAYHIQNIPVSLLERVEVYKGVVPVSLGADALGGAVHLVSKARHQPHLYASYEIASFNTHLANLSGYYTDKSQKKFAGIDFFYNYSDNNYQADVTVTDPVTANPAAARVRLFHNHYRQYYTEAYAGIKNTRWTDELKFTLTQHQIRRASQHPTLMTVPYGAVMMYNTGWIGSLRYQKRLLKGKLHADQFFTYSHVTRNRIDTVKGTYNWYGEFIPRQNGIGESPRPSNSDIDFNTFISRTYLRYALHANHSIELNYTFHSSHRLGKDPYGLKIKGTGTDILSKEASYMKSVAGLSWESKYFRQRLTNQLLVKYFSFHTRGIDGFMDVNSNPEDYKTVGNHHWGIGNALKYQLNDRSFIRASAELTYRLPTQPELFGDNDTRAPNFSLQPEKSLNINLGYHYRHNRIRFEAGGFYRETKGMILLVPIQPPFSQYMNLDSIRGYGVDMDIHYRLTGNLYFSGNLTWQENRMVHISNALYQWMEGTRLRNTPFFFGNLSLSAVCRNTLFKKDLWKPYIHYNYIREFYLNPIPRDKEPAGFLGIFGKSGVPVTNLIPDQHLLSAGFTYTFPLPELTIGFEIKNILDEKLYDYYKIQRPGRSFHLKLNYLFTRTDRSYEK